MRLPERQLLDSESVSGKSPNDFVQLLTTLCNYSRRIGLPRKNAGRLASVARGGGDD